MSQDSHAKNDSHMRACVKITSEIILRTHLHTIRAQSAYSQMCTYCKKFAFEIIKN